MGLSPLPRRYGLLQEEFWKQNNNLRHLTVLQCSQLSRRSLKGREEKAPPGGGGGAARETGLHLAHLLFVTSSPLRVRTEATREIAPATQVELLMQLTSVIITVRRCSSLKW